MKYLLDTCVISDFIKGEKNTLSHLKMTTPSEIVVSSITVMEIHYGLVLNPKLAEKIKPILIGFLSTVHIPDFNEAMRRR